MYKLGGIIEIIFNWYKNESTWTKSKTWHLRFAKFYYNLRAQYKIDILGYAIYTV